MSINRVNDQNSTDISFQIAVPSGFQHTENPRIVRILLRLLYYEVQKEYFYVLKMDTGEDRNDHSTSYYVTFIMLDLFRHDYLTS